MPGMTSAAPFIGAVKASPQQLAWNIGTTGMMTSRDDTPMASPMLAIIECSTFERCEYRHALGMAGGAGGVAHAGCGILVEALPGEVAVGLGDPVLIGDRVLQRRRPAYARRR